MFPPGFVFLVDAVRGARPMRPSVRLQLEVQQDNPIEFSVT
jgi:hypothetical protein